MEELNELTKKLYAEGYTRNNYPDYVWLGDWQNLEYKWDYLKETIWESQCGICLKAWNYIGGYATYYDGVAYCPENDNVIVQCPPLQRAGCKYFNKTLLGCVWHMSDKPYDYENSLEKLEKEYSGWQHKAWIEVTGGTYCPCLGRYDDVTGKYLPRYDLRSCLNCDNEFCIIRKKSRDLTKVNVFYDVRRTWKSRRGLIQDERIEIEKGVKVFEKPVAKTDAEIWLKMYYANLKKFRCNEPIAEIHPKSRDYSYIFFSKMHRKYGDMEDFEFLYEPFNFRIEKRESRDLLQDLYDVAEGIEVVHTSDLAKAKVIQKRESKEKRAEEKAKCNLKKRIETFKKALVTGTWERIDGEIIPLDDTMRSFVERELTKYGVSVEPENPKSESEQTSLF